MIRVAPYRLGRIGLRGLGVAVAAFNPVLNNNGSVGPVYSINPGPVIVAVPTSDGVTPISTINTEQPPRGAADPNPIVNPIVVPTTGSTPTTPVVATPTSGPIPSPSTTAAATTTTATDPFTALLTGSILGGIPNWVLLGAGLLLVMKKK